MSAPLADTFTLQSRPAATKRIYLDFTGHVTSGTAWRGGATFNTPAYSLDADYANFSDAELTAIQDVWSRVAEDFAPFDVDVTTLEPALADLVNEGGADDRWGIRVVIGGDGSWNGAAGVAYMNSFSWDSDTPCFVFADQSWKTNLIFLATSVSHEVGHSLGLSHDGFGGSEYYGGRGTGETSWGPIMGNPGSANLTQWSRGDYGNATNTEDDLAIIVTGNGFGYRADDHGDTTQSATVVAAPAGTFRAAGIIGASTDVDVFQFVSGGTIAMTISPLTVGPNLDVLATILDQGGATVATSNPADRVGASFTLTVAAGTYWLAVRGTGMGDPATTGYTNYGSLGQYSIEATVGVPTVPVVALAVLDADKAEGNTGNTSFTFTVSRTGDTTGASSAQWSVVGSGASAAGASDFAGGTLPAGTVAFAAGETSQTITVSVAGDTTVEPDETFTVTIAGLVNATPGITTAIGTIRNDDAPPPALAITAANAQRAEGNAGGTAFTFTVTRTGDATGTSSAQWTVSGGGANPASATDFVGGVLPSGTTTFAPGETTKTITVTVAGDTAIEADETFVVTLSNATNAALGTATASGTIRNDDGAAILDVAATSADKAEGQSGSTPFTFRLTRQGNAAGVSTVQWSVVTSGADTVTAADFVGGALPSGIVTFSPAETTKTITVNVAGDAFAEQDEWFSVTLTNPVGAVLGLASANGRIRNDDGTPTLAIATANATKAEGNSGSTQFTFTVTRRGGSAGTSSALWTVGGGTAANAASQADFAGSVYPTGTVAFGPGETSKTVVVLVAGDTTRESDETFSVTLSGAMNATLLTTTATGTILNDDDLPTIAIATSAVSNTEGNFGSTPFSFIVTRSGSTSGTATVNWSASTAFGASASDFTGGRLPSGVLTFAAGEKSKTITINVAGDTAVETDEGFIVTLMSAQNATLGVSRTAVGTIRNDDSLPVLSFASSGLSLAEGNFGTTLFVYTVNRSGNAGVRSSVRWSVSAGFGAAGSDFMGGMLPSGNLTFSPNEMSKQISIYVIGDRVVEGDEMFSVILTNAEGATLGSSFATGTIRNDDQATRIAAFVSLGDAGTINRHARPTRAWHVVAVAPTQR